MCWEAALKQDAITAACEVEAELEQSRTEIDELHQEMYEQGQAPDIRSSRCLQITSLSAF